MLDGYDPVCVAITASNGVSRIIMHKDVRHHLCSRDVNVFIKTISLEGWTLPEVSTCLKHQATPQEIHLSD